METHTLDEQLREVFERNSPPLDEAAFSDHLRERTGRSRNRAIAPRRTSGVRVVLYASLAVVIVAAVTVGSLEAVKYLGGAEPILVITDETTVTTEATTVTSTPQTTLTTAPAVIPTLGPNWEHLPMAADGGVVYVLVVDPTNPAVLYAITDWGLFKSTDGAAHWTRLSVEAGWGATIVVDPVSPSTLYVWAGGLHRSLDGGATWTRIGDEIEIMHWWIDSSTSPSTLWGTSGRDGDDPNNILYKSTDEGSTWKEFSRPSFLVLGQFITVDPTNHMLYAIYPGVGMRSFDGGATWEDISAGLPVDADRRLVLDPRDPSRLYLYPGPAATLEPPVFASTDKAQTWTKLAGPELDWARAVLKVGPATPAAAIEAATAFLADFDGTVTDASSGVQVSGEGGGWWDIQPWRVVLDPDDPSVVYVRTSQGVYKSTDQGATWNNTSFGMTTPAVYSVLVDPLSPTTIYATTSASIAKSTDGGASWVTILEIPVVQYRQTSGGSLLLAPSSPTRLYATGKNGLLRSDDAGATWTQLAGAGLPDLTQEYSEVDLMLVGSDQPDTVFAKSWGDSGCGLYRSTDGGNTWSEVTGLPDRPWVSDMSLAEAPDDPSTLYAGVINIDGEGPAYNGLFKSTDGGKTWALAGDRSSWGFGVSALAIDPHNPLNIYAVQHYQLLWRSTDGGETWTQVAEFDHFNYSGNGPHQLICDPRAFGTLYACANEGLYRSTDGGATWQDMTEGRRSDTVVSTCVIDPASSDGLYAATEQGLCKWVSDDE